MCVRLAPGPSIVILADRCASRYPRTIRRLVPHSSRMLEATLFAYSSASPFDTARHIFIDTHPKLAAVFTIEINKAMLAYAVVVPLHEPTVFWTHLS
jgi:hypothetical protein